MFEDLWDWLQTLKPNYPDAADWWDGVVKPYIKEFCIQFSKLRKKKRSDTKRFWFAYLKCVMCAKDWTEVARVKNIIKSMLEEDMYGYVVRSRFAYNASDEAASVFHANREMNNAKKKIYNS